KPLHHSPTRAIARAIQPALVVLVSSSRIAKASRGGSRRCPDDAKTRSGDFPIAAWDSRRLGNRRSLNTESARGKNKARCPKDRSRFSPDAVKAHHEHFRMDERR